MTVGLLVVAVALVVWPGGIAVDRLRALDAPVPGSDGATTVGGGAPGAHDAPRGPGAPIAAAASLRRVVTRIPAGLLWPAAAGVVGLVGAGPLHGCAAAVLGGVAAELRGRAVERRSRVTRLGAWERALDDAASALRAGAGPGTALDRAADAAAPHDPRVASTLSVAGAHARLGGDVAQALRTGAIHGVPAGGAGGAASATGSGGSAQDGADDPVPGELAGAWLLATRHGVELADVVDGLRADVCARRERAVRVHATLAGPRATAVILTALPGLGVLLGAGFGADPLGVLLGGALGGILCLAGAVLLAAGLLWTDRIARGADR